MTSIWNEWLELLITFVVGFGLTYFIGKPVLHELRVLKAGQEIRKEGPSWHAGKAGTPTMGGIMFIIAVGIAVFVLGWNAMMDGEFDHLYVYLFSSGRGRSFFSLFLSVRKSLPSRTLTGQGKLVSIPAQTRIDVGIARNIPFSFSRR